MLLLWTDLCLMNRILELAYDAGMRRLGGNSSRRAEPKPLQMRGLFERVFHFISVSLPMFFSASIDL